MREPSPGNIQFQTIAVGAIAGAAIGGTMKAVIGGLQKAREEREEAAYAAAVDELQGDAEALGVVAKRIVQELAAARAENARLKKALAQRQAFIERMRKQRDR